MRLFRSVIIAWLGLGMLVMAASAAITDLRTVRTDVYRALPPATCTAFPPLVGFQTCVHVVVQNLGPDPYTSTIAAPQPPPGGSGKPLAGQLVITTDIDEPTKPDGEPMRTAATFTRSFTVNIAVMDSVSCDFGVISWVPMSPGTHAARSTCFAGSPNVDPNPTNDRMLTIFRVSIGLPAAGLLGLAVLAAVLGIVAAVWVRRTRGVRPA